MITILLADVKTNASLLKIFVRIMFFTMNVSEINYYINFCLFYFLLTTIL